MSFYGIILGIQWRIRYSSVVKWTTRLRSNIFAAKFSYSVFDKKTYFANQKVVEMSYFFFLLTYAEIRIFNWLTALFSGGVSKKKEPAKRTAILGHVNRLMVSFSGKNIYFKKKIFNQKRSQKLDPIRKNRSHFQIQYTKIISNLFLPYMPKFFCWPALLLICCEIKTFWDL